MKKDLLGSTCCTKLGDGSHSCTFAVPFFSGAEEGFSLDLTHQLPWSFNQSLPFSYSRKIKDYERTMRLCYTARRRKGNLGHSILAATGGENGEEDQKNRSHL